jgi:DnaJ-domain-containing protein 1
MNKIKDAISFSKGRSRVEAPTETEQALRRQVQLLQEQLRHANASNAAQLREIQGLRALKGVAMDEVIVPTRSGWTSPTDSAERITPLPKPTDSLRQEVSAEQDALYKQIRGSASSVEPEAAPGSESPDEHMPAMEDEFMDFTW